MPQGSPSVQFLLAAAAILYLIFETWNGWRRGVVRSAITLAAFVIAGLAALIVGKVFSTLLQNIIGIPPLAIGVLFGGIAGIAVFVLIWFFGALLFKRTGQQNSSTVKLLYGLGGACLGFLTGLVILWSIIPVIRLFGAAAESRMVQTSDNPEDPPKNPGAMTSGLVTIKQSLEMGPAGQVVQSVDVVPAQMYDLITKVGRLRADEKAQMRFFEYPGIQEVIENPVIVSLFEDPAVIDAVQSENYFVLLQNKRVIEAVNDPELVKLLKKIDIEAALDYSLAQPTPTPSPSATPSKKSATKSGNPPSRKKKKT